MLRTATLPAASNEDQLDRIIVSSSRLEHQVSLVAFRASFLILSLSNSHQLGRVIPPSIHFATPVQRCSRSVPLDSLYLLPSGYQPAEESTCTRQLTGTILVFDVRILHHLHLEMLVVSQRREGVKVQLSSVHRLGCRGVLLAQSAVGDCSRER